MRMRAGGLGLNMIGLGASTNIDYLEKGRATHDKHAPLASPLGKKPP
jgi:hypothetical protein